MYLNAYTYFNDSDVVGVLMYLNAYTYFNNSDVVGVSMYMNVYTYFNDSDVVGVFRLPLQVLHRLLLGVLVAQPRLRPRNPQLTLLLLNASLSLLCLLLSSLSLPVFNRFLLFAFQVTLFLFLKVTILEVNTGC